MATHRQRCGTGAAACKWRKKGSFELFRDVVILMRDTGMRNERELYRIRIEYLNWASRTIFVPDSKTEEGRRSVPMTNRSFEILKRWCEGRTEGWVFPAKRGKSGHRTTMAERFRQARKKAGLPEELKLYCWRHDYGTGVLRKDWQPEGRDESDGTSGCEDGDEVPTS